ncbi:hypothetical protein ACH4PU_22225 [Streptomyces sp. NPDC021100]|uniref:hypothetical protein n=1 Tax=Streptomyces sp. NPDC021100 TaxID=3365114 RepID=UPI0037AB5D17
MTSQHTHLTPDLPPVVEVPDLPGAQGPRPSGAPRRRGERSDAGDDGGSAGSRPSRPAERERSGNERGAHHEGDGRHGCAGEGSGG